MTVSRTFDAATLNEVANHPQVRPWLGGEGALDLGPVVADPANVTLQTAAGGFIGVAQGEGRYEIHSIFHPDRETQAAVEAMRQGLAYLFLRTDAVDLVTKVPLDNKAALGLVRLGGFKKLCEAQARWRGPERRPVAVYTLGLDAWAALDPAMVAAGQGLHVWFEQHGVLAHDDDDDAHDAFAGAAWKMIQHGNVLKGARLYNRYAAWSGYVPLTVVSLQPVVVRQGALAVEVTGPQMEIVPCQSE